MPMFKALAACPHAVVVRPDMVKYRRTGALVRRLMREVTPLVEPLSIDEAFLNLGDAPGIPAVAAASLARRIERSEEHTSELQSLMRISYAGFCLKKKNTT